MSTGGYLNNESEIDHWSIVKSRILAMLERRFDPPTDPVEKIIWLKRIEGVEGLWDEKHLQQLEWARTALKDTKE